MNRSLNKEMSNRPFYINANFSEQFFLCYGLDFSEFISCNPVELKNILVTDGNLHESSFNQSWLFETVNGTSAIRNIANQDIYSLGNFHWIDYDDESSLDNCSPEEKAGILYISHFGKSLKSAFFESLNNNFVYLSHDDGWYCKLYCKDMFVFKELISNRIIRLFSGKKKRKINPMNENVKDEIFELTKKGILIDIPNICRKPGNININFYVIGQYEDMDDMYDNLKKKKQRSAVKGTISYKNKTWQILVRD